MHEIGQVRPAAEDDPSVEDGIHRARLDGREAELGLQCFNPNVSFQAIWLCDGLTKFARDSASRRG